MASRRGSDGAIQIAQKQQERRSSLEENTNYKSRTLNLTASAVSDNKTTETKRKSNTKKNINITVQTMTGKQINITINPDSTVLKLKKKIQDKEGIPTDQQRLRFSTELKNNKQLFEYDIQNDSKLILILNLRGNNSKDNNEEEEEKETDEYEAAEKAFKYSCLYDYENINVFTSKYEEYKAVLMTKGSHFVCLVCEFCNTETIQYILENGGKQFINQASHNNEYPFDKLCVQYDKKSTQKDIHKQTMRLLIENGGELCTEAVRIAMMDDKELFEYMLTNIDNAEEFDKYPINMNGGYKKRRFQDLMNSAKDIETMKKLAGKGAKYNAFCLSSQFNGYSETNDKCDFILTQGIDINERGDDGNTVLHEACNSFIASESTIKFVRYLLINGADPLSKNGKGETAKDVAFSKWKVSSTQGEGVNPFTIILMDLNRDIACCGLCSCDCWHNNCCSNCQLLSCICGPCSCSCVPLYCCFWYCLGCCHK